MCYDKGSTLSALFLVDGATQLRLSNINHCIVKFCHKNGWYWVDPHFIFLKSHVLDEVKSTPIAERLLANVSIDSYCSIEQVCEGIDTCSFNNIEVKNDTGSRLLYCRFMSDWNLYNTLSEGNNNDNVRGTWYTLTCFSNMLLKATATLRIPYCY